MSGISINKGFNLQNIISEINGSQLKKEKEITKNENNFNINDNNSELSKLSPNNAMKSLNFIDSDVSNSLLGVVNFAYSAIEGNLNQSQRDTALAIKTSFENVISGNPTNLRESFLLVITKEIFNFSSKLSDEELKNLETNKEARAKVLIKHNNLVDKMMNAKNLNDFSKDEIVYLEKNYNIKIVEENNELVFYYTDSQGNKKKINKDDLKQLKIDLNNIISSSDLFKLSMVTGKAYLQYEEEKYLPSNLNNENKKENYDLNKNDNIEDFNEEIKKETLNQENSYKQEINEDIQPKKYKNFDSKIVEEAFFKKVLEKEEEEQKYHLEQLNQISERRKKIEKELNEERLNNKYKYKN